MNSFRKTALQENLLAAENRYADSNQYSDDGNHYQELRQSKALVTIILHDDFPSALLRQ